MSSAPAIPSDRVEYRLTGGDSRRLKNDYGINLPAGTYVEMVVTGSRAHASGGDRVTQGFLVHDGARLIDVETQEGKEFGNWRWPVDKAV